MYSTILLVSVALAQRPDSPMVRLVQSDLRSRSDEAMAPTPASPDIGPFALLDVDHDGQPELFVIIRPSFEQSPTVAAYRRTGASSVARLYEGLAPGRPMRSSGRLVDSHTRRIGADVVFDGIRDSVTVARFLSAARGQGVHAVRYPDFFHLDMRDSNATYVDMSEVLDTLTASNCRGIEFPVPDGIAAGRIAPDTSRSYLAVLTPAEITYYYLSGIRLDGTFVKSIRIVNRPTAVVTIGVSPDGWLVGADAAGHQTPLQLPAGAIPPN